MRKNFLAAQRADRTPTVKGWPKRHIYCLAMLPAALLAFQAMEADKGADPRVREILWAALIVMDLPANELLVN